MIAQMARQPPRYWAGVFVKQPERQDSCHAQHSAFVTFSSATPIGSSGSTHWRASAPLSPSVDRRSLLSIAHAAPMLPYPA
jgi:hypothetical protein